MKEIKNITSLKEFVDFLEDECFEENILFRGQRREDWKLLPKIARIDLNEETSHAERVMLKEFKRQAIPHLKIKPNDDWEWLALAQHHGMATRLLDWTKNPLAALWFAVRKTPCKNINGVVWVFEVVGENLIKKMDEDPLAQHITKVYQPNNIADSIIAQQGWFTIHGYSKNNKKFVALENNKRYSERLIKIRIKPKYFQDIRFQLDRCGINYSSMFPSLNGLCQHIEWLNSYMSDESR